ncbi:MAG: hypothetical protein KJ051_13655 [Thermoleophilia bacterium]|nr:hypothetical protein [Thermoleophilia bacterium]
MRRSGSSASQRTAGASAPRRLGRHHGLALVALGLCLGAPSPVFGAVDRPLASVATVCAGETRGEQIFHDDFDGYPAKLTVSSLGTAWSTEGGTNVDVIGNGFYDLLPGNGNYVDMEGSGGNPVGHLKTTRQFPAGQYCLRVWLGGNQRNGEADTVRIRFGGASRVVTRGGSAPFTVEELLVDFGTPSAIELIAGGVGSKVVGLLVGEVELVEIGTTPPTQPPPGGTPPGKSISMPDPGKTRTVKFPIPLHSVKAAVRMNLVFDLFEDEISAIALSLSEKKRKLKDLRDARARTETICMVALSLPDASVEGLLGAALDARSCREALAEVQAEIDELEAQRAPQGTDPGEPACSVVSLRLRSEVRHGKRTTRVVKKGLARLSKVTCKATDTGLEVDIRRRGQGTLRQAYGKRLAVTVRRSATAPAPPPGVTLAFDFTSR